MLYIANNLRELSFRQLMEVYAEGNMENAKELWPELPLGQGIIRAEQDFYQYLKECFFPTQGAFYALWVENGKYVSALRLEPYRDGLLLAALETAPEHRRQGYAKELIQTVLTELPRNKIYSHVSKKNIASLKTHGACGFQRILEHAVYADGSVLTTSCTLCRET
ncbi:MAG: GNAT family N-acetyltransferase [Ruminococcaceae bacterium]|nr:GNAT family N-acetyltransferase [Oscillospiraceae bacterium]